MAKFSENHQIAEGTAFSHCGFFSMLFLCGGRGEEITHREDVEENRKKDWRLYSDRKKAGGGGIFIYSSVFTGARKSDNLTVVVKICENKKANDVQAFEAQVQKEITIMQKLQHPNIIQLYDHLDDQQRYQYVCDNTVD